MSSLPYKRYLEEVIMELQHDEEVWAKITNSTLEEVKVTRTSVVTI